MDDDLALLDAWANGDRGAAATLLDRYVDPLGRFFRGKVSTDVEDCVQETFTRCLAQRRGLAPGSSFRAYLFATARNLIYERFRKAARGQIDPEQVSLADLGPTPSAIVGRDQERQLMLAALQRIPVESQLAIELYYWEGLAVAEMASVLQIPAGTVKSRLHRARGQLRRQLEQLDQAEAAVRDSLTRLTAWDRDETD
ncbi:MAG: RNA polymerase sigma factor [Myxococcota bacterium]